MDSKQKITYLFFKEQMQILALATGHKVRPESFYWTEMKLPKNFIDDMRAIGLDVTNLVFAKDAQFISVSYVTGGETVEKVYDFYVPDYKNLTLEKSIILIDRFYNLFMKKLGCKIEKPAVFKIMPVKIEQKIEANNEYTNKIKSEIVTIKKALEGAQKAFENEVDDVLKVKLSVQIEQFDKLIKIREELLIKEENKVKAILENHETLEKKVRDEEFAERERLLKEMEMPAQETPYLQAVKTMGA